MGLRIQSAFTVFHSRLQPSSNAGVDIGTDLARFGTVYCVGVSQSSDETLKEQIGPSALGLAFVRETLRPVQYVWKRAAPNNATTKDANAADGADGAAGADGGGAAAWPVGLQHGFLAQVRLDCGPWTQDPRLGTLNHLAATHRRHHSCARAPPHHLLVPGRRRHLWRSCCAQLSTLPRHHPLRLC